MIIRPTEKGSSANRLPSSTTPENTRDRTGKIARLPQELRELINLMLRDGAAYSLVIGKLAQSGHVLNADNLSRWYAGGYQDWLQEQAWLEEMRQRLNFATDIVNQSNSAFLEAASLRIAVTRMYSLLLNFHPAVLKNQLATQPGAYSRILNVLCKLTEGAIRCERHRLEQAGNTHRTHPSDGHPSPSTTGGKPP